MKLSECLEYAFGGSMFHVGQHVIHPGQGVCTVTGFTDDATHPMILLCAKQATPKRTSCTPSPSKTACTP